MKPARPRLGHHAALDGLRGLAVLAVVADHGLSLPSGFIGVTVFFVLSGFLITTLLLEEWESDGDLRLRRFYRRRIWRLYPALAVTVAAYVLIVAGLAVSGSGESPVGPALAGAAVSMSYVANVYSVSYGLPEGLRHLWSLAAEEQFYVVWPLLLAVALRRRVAARTLLASLAGVTLFLILYRTILTLAGMGAGRLYESPDTTADGLALGCLIAFAVHGGFMRRVARSPWACRFAGACGLIVLAAVILNGAGVTDRSYYLWLLAVVDVAAGLVILSCVLDSRGFAARMLSARWLTWCGRISYSLYLVHPLVLVVLVVRHPLLTPIEAIAVSFVVAYAVYRFVELPLRARGRRAPSEAGNGGRTAGLREPPMVAVGVEAR